MNWNWVNRKAEDDVESISILALLESFVAATLYALIAIKWGTLHLTISAIIAPFLLLRTATPPPDLRSWEGLPFSPYRNGEGHLPTTGLGGAGTSRRGWGRTGKLEGVTPQ